MTGNSFVPVPASCWRGTSCRRYQRVADAFPVAGGLLFSVTVILLALFPMQPRDGIGQRRIFVSIKPVFAFDASRLEKKPFPQPVFLTTFLRSSCHWPHPPGMLLILPAVRRRFAALVASASTNHTTPGLAGLSTTSRVDSCRESNVLTVRGIRSIFPELGHQLSASQQ